MERKGSTEIISHATQYWHYNIQFVLIYMTGKMALEVKRGFSDDGHDRAHELSRPRLSLHTYS